MKHLSVLVPAGLLDVIDATAAERNWNRTEFVRWAISHALLRGEPSAYVAPTLPNWQTEAWTALLRGIFGSERLILTADVKPLLMQAVAALNNRQARVLHLRFGLDGPRHTQEETAAIMGWDSRQRVHQVEVEALRRVRGWCRVWGIWKMIEEQLDREEA